MPDQARIKVDIHSGVVEIEAPLDAIDGLLARVEQFLPRLSDARVAAPPRKEPPSAEQKRPTPAPAPAGDSSLGGDAPRKPRAPRKETGELRVLPDLNLRPTGKQSLRQFYEEKDPKSNEKGFAVIVYYHKKILEVETVTLNHIYTSLKELGIKVPTRLQTVLSNSAGRHGWIDTKNKDDIKINIHGENFVEHDLPPKTTTSRSR